MTIGERIRELRGRMTLKEFAEPLGVSGNAISNIENNRSEPSNDLSIRICDTYGCTMDWLIRGIEPNTSKTIDENTVTINKDELLNLYRLLSKQQQDQIDQLKNQQLKNIDPVSG